jgi:polysaccharide biosynthesis protein PslG
MRRKTIFLTLSALLIIAASLFLARDAIRAALFSVTGEEELLAQGRGLIDVATNLIRPMPNTADDALIDEGGISPFGINTFLEQEVEPAKRDRQLQMMADAGFKWIRQQFPWYDLEIAGKGDFQDCRHPPCINAWAKYDNIVDLAEQHGINIIARLEAPPKWAQSTPGDFAPPSDLTDFGDYVAAVADRYQGRITHYQIWNEPNNYPEWGEQPVNPEDFTKLLCTAYRRIKAVDPQAKVLAPALTPTISLEPGPGPGTGLNDFIFLQRMYDAGAGQCFDIMSAQAYGLFSGPTDRRMRPRNVNFARPMYIRDLMVQNGDAHKPIWLSEMNWNAVPDEVADKRFGQVSQEAQARYLPLAYERIQKEWPWIGVASTWFFKRASDAEKDQGFYYFRLVDPDFTPQPVYDAMKAYTEGK